MQTTLKLSLYAAVLALFLFGCNKNKESKELIAVDIPINRSQPVPPPPPPPLNKYSDVSGNSNATQQLNTQLSGTLALASNMAGTASTSESAPPPPKILSSSAAVETGKDTAHRFIRTADIKFKAKNVIATTYAIEDIAQHFKGFVTYTNLTSTIDNKTTITVSADSSLETTYFTIVNNMQLRVPNSNLDSTLKSLAPLIDFLDYRNIKANDISLEVLGNQLAQARLAKHEQRLINAIDAHGKKLNETESAEDDLLNRQEQADNAKISNLTINDQVKFSTITLNIYQRQSIKREMILNDRNIDSYEVSFFVKIVDGLNFGLKILESVILFIINLWGLILFALIAFVIFKMYKTHVRKP